MPVSDRPRRSRARRFRRSASICRSTTCSGCWRSAGRSSFPIRNRHFEPAHWAELIERHKITVWNSVPAFMEMFTAHVASRNDGRLRIAAARDAERRLDCGFAARPYPCDRSQCGSDQPRRSDGGFDLVDLLSDRSSSILPGRAFPTAVPLTNQTVYVLDDDLQRCDVGASGEIYIGGDGVAVGYWNRPDLNREKFIPDPFSTRPRRQALSNRRPGTLLGRRQHRVPGPDRSAGQDSRVPDRTGRNRDGVGAAPADRRSRSSSPGKVPRARSRWWRFWSPSRHAAISDKEVSEFLRQSLARLHDSRAVRADRSIAAECQRESQSNGAVRKPVGERTWANRQISRALHRPILLRRATRLKTQLVRNLGRGARHSARRHSRHVFGIGRRFVDGRRCFCSHRTGISPQPAAGLAARAAHDRAAGRAIARSAARSADRLPGDLARVGRASAADLSARGLRKSVGVPAAGEKTGAGHTALRLATRGTRWTNGRRMSRSARSRSIIWASCARAQPNGPYYLAGYSIWRSRGL